VKKLLVILFFILPFLVHGQQLNRDQWGNQLYIVPVWEGWCEYLNTYIRSSDSTWWAGGNDIALRGLGSATAPQAVPTAVPVAGIKFIQISNGLHDNFAISSIADTSFGYEIGANNYGQRGDGTTNTQTTAYKLRYDSSGNLFDSLKIIAGGWQAANNAPFYAAVKNNGSVWMWGYLASGGAGNQSAGGTLKKPISVTLAGGKIAEFIQCNDDCAVLCSDSTVQTWGNDNSYASNLGRTYSGTGNRSPTDIGLSHIVSIAVGYGFNYAIDVSGHVHFWGQFEAYGGYGATSGTATTPIDITTALALSATPKKIVCNHNATMGLLSNGEVVSWGGIPTGSTAQGVDFNWPAYTTPASGTNPYNGTVPSPWNWYLEYFNNSSADFTDYTVQVKQVAPGKSNFVQIFGGQLYDFDFACEDSTGQFYQAGRNKGAVIANGTYAADTLSSTIEADFPVSWDQIYLVLTNPFNVTVVQEVTSPYCVLNPSTAPCPNYTIPTRTHPHASVTSFTTAPGRVVLNGSASTAYYFNNRLWTQLTGPATTQMAIQTSPTDTVILITPGTYTYKYKITDDVWQSDSAVSTIIVSAVAQTGFYFADTATGTGCTLAWPCPPSLFNSVYATESGGDTNYLKRGDVFPIEMVANSSGSSGNPIVTRPYGTGPEPIIGGMTTQTGWTNIGSNVWQVAYTSGVIPNLLAANDTLWNVARTPNFLSGYHIATSTTSNTITDAANAGTVSTGDSIVYRPNPYTFNHRKVSGVAGSVITVSSNFGTIAGGLGWFKYNTLPDTAYEYRMNSGNLQVYSVNTPTNITTPTVDTCLLSEGTYQEWDSLHFSGGNNAGIILAFQANSGNVFKWDTVDYCFDAFQMRTQGGWSLINCHILHCVDGGVQKQGNSNYNNTYLSDTLIDIGMRPGMGGENGDQNYSALVAGDSGSIVKYCEVYQAGYIGIANYGSRYKSDSNWVNFFCQVAEDGGGLYTYQASGSVPSYRPENVGDVISNGGSYLAHNGMNPTLTPAAYGVYNDNYSSNIYSNGVSVYNVSASSFFCHGPNDTFINCTAYASGLSDLYLYEISTGPVITGTYVKHNVFGSGTWSVAAVRFATVNNDIPTMATSDSNQVAGFNGAPNPYWTFATSGGDPGTFRTLAGWTGLTGYDAHTTYQTGVLGFNYNGTSSNSTQNLNNLYKTLNGAFKWGSITLSPYTSQVLINVGVGIQIQIGSKLNVL
jgi:hypothetical protein